MGFFWTKPAPPSLVKRLEDLCSDVEALKRTNRSLELEFTELYDKVRHQMSRMAKRAAVADKESGDGLDPNPPAAPAGEIDPISAKILARRGMRRQAN